MELSAEKLAQEAEAALAAVYPPVPPRLYDLNALFALLLEQRGDDGELDDDEGEITPFEAPPLQFEEGTIQLVISWLRAKFTSGQSWQLDELLVEGDDAGFGWATRRCMVLILYRAYSHSESEFPNMTADALDEFISDVARGTNLRFSPKGDRDD
jgi:hypothetical protein